MKAPNGYGSISNMGKGRRRPFRVVITVGWKKNDKGEYTQDRKTLGYYATRKEAMIALAEYNANPYNVDTLKITFGEVYDLWKKRGLEGLSEGTQKNYISSFKRLGSIADRPISELKTADLQALMDEAKGMSRATEHNILKILHKTYEYAMQNDIIDKDYSHYVKSSGSSGASTMHKPYTPEEVKFLWEHLKEPVEIMLNRKPRTIYPVDMVLMGIYTGCRPGELLTIKSIDVNLKEHYMIGGIKNEQSRNRIIPLHDDIMPLVTQRMELEQETMLGHTLEQYRYIHKMTMLQLVMDHLPHDGRHTFATFAKQSPVEDFYISKIMGHKLNSITERVYTHVTPADLVREINKIKFV